MEWQMLFTGPSELEEMEERRQRCSILGGRDLSVYLIFERFGKSWEVKRE